MLKSNFDKLKDDELVLYIYQLGPSIYGLSGKERYLVIVKDDWKGVDLEGDEIDVEIIGINEWFERVKAGNIEAWICACLNRKFIIKEYVKLMMQTNPVQLRQDINFLAFTTKSLLEDKVEDIKSQLFDTIAYTIFARQIVENHKIVNFAEPAKYYEELNDKMSLEDFNKIYTPVFEEFKELTQGIWIKHLKDKVYTK
jgi:hypothetical protein